ncbi:MAG: hypothetical protein ACFFCO_10460, partial [Promethearchaeota archaeon]
VFSQLSLTYNSTTGLFEGVISESYYASGDTLQFYVEVTNDADLTQVEDNNGQYFVVVVHDWTPPTITFPTEDMLAFFATNITDNEGALLIEVMVEEPLDGSGVDPDSITLFFVVGTTTGYIDMEKRPLTTLYYASIPQEFLSVHNTLVSWWIVAYDNAGNEQATAIMELRVIDDVPPSIVLSNFPTVANGTVYHVELEVSDASGIGYVEVRFSFDAWNTTFTGIMDTSTKTGERRKYIYNIPLEETVEDLRFFFITADTLGNTHFIAKGGWSYALRANVTGTEWTAVVGAAKTNAFVVQLPPPSASSEQAGVNPLPFDPTILLFLIGVLGFGALLIGGFILKRRGANSKEEPLVFPTSNGNHKGQPPLSPASSSSSPTDPLQEFFKRTNTNHQSDSPRSTTPNSTHRPTNPTFKCPAPGCNNTALEKIGEGYRCSQCGAVLTQEMQLRVKLNLKEET